jgi:hypothetical protein
VASVRWHWVSEDGSEREVSEEELIAGLSSEHVPVYALVWREGWGEWLPAMQVAELSWALPAGQADNPRRPSSGSHQKPVPNLASYPLLRQRAAKIREQGTTNPNAEAALRPRAPAPKSTRRVDVPQQPSLTLPKPPLAKNPPERSWPPQVESEDATVVERPMRGPPPQAYSAAKVGSQFSAEDGAGKPVWRSRLMIIAILGAALTAWLIADGLSGVTKVVRSVKSRATGAKPAMPSATATELDGPARAPVAPVPVCKVRRGRQLAEWADATIRPTLLSLATGNVAIGYGQTKGYGIGINVSLKSLDREFAFHDAKKQTMFSVVPSFEKGQLVFGVTRAPSDIINATAISGSVRRVIGQGQGGVAMREGTGAIKRIWQLPENGRPISVPFTAPLANGGAAVTLRAGGEKGSIHVGMLDAQGKPSSELVRLESGAEAFGEPSLAVRGDTTVVVFAGRKANEANWNLFVASGKGGAAPTSAKPLSLGTPNSTATFIGPLGEHYFLLMWTDRSALESITKTVVLDDQFRVLGSPMELSEETQLSTSGGLAVSGTDALAAYFVTVGENTEMWGASLRCL